MRYLLDTNACITYLNDRASSVARHLQMLAPSDVAVCSVVRAELHFGALRSRASKSATAGVSAFLAPFQSVPFDDAAAEVYAEIRADLTGKGTLIGPNDLLIAATALSRRLILVTHNGREFGRVHGLAMEDWEVE